LSGRRSIFPMKVDLLAIQPSDVDKAWLVEYAARACYGAPLSPPEKRLAFLTGLAQRGHLSVFEHARFCEFDYVQREPAIDSVSEARNGYWLRSFNARHLLERNPQTHLADIFDREPQIPYGALTPAQRVTHAGATFEIAGVSRVTTHQIVRHRLASYSQESERHVAADLDLAVIPPSIAENEAARYVFQDALAGIIDAVYELRRLGIPQEDVRYLYPQAAPTRIVVTMRYSA